MKTVIRSYCKIKNNAAWVNGNEIIITGDSTDLTSFLSALYRQIAMSYPKFFKMDNLCKLGMLVTELAIRNNADFEKYSKERTAIVLSNNASSIETDRNHIKTIADKSQYFPSPAVFVYTLPNIVIGEIGIKYKLTGENAFFVSEAFDAGLLHNYVSILLENGHTDAVISGWVNVDGNAYDAFVYCVEKSNFNQHTEPFYQPHTIEALQQLYNH